MLDPGSPAHHDSPWKSRLLAHGPALAWTFFLCWALLSPADDLKPIEDRFPWDLPEGFDKIFHGLLFYFETLFLVRSLRAVRLGPSTTPMASTFAITWAIILAITLGALTEGAQLWIPNRHADGVDWIADTIGALAGGIWMFRLAGRE